MSNIAEGFERDGNKEFCNFLSIAEASAGEVKSHIYAALDQNNISQVEFEMIYRKADETGRLIAGFMKYLQKTDIKGLKFKKSETVN